MTGAPRILHVIDHMGTGGAQENVCEVIEGLRGFAHFDVATLFGGTKYAGRLEAAGATLHQLESTHAYSPARALDPRPSAALRRLLARERYDIVHAHLYVAPLALRWIRRTDRRGIIVSLHAERSTLPAYVFPSFRLIRGIVDTWVVPDEDQTPGDLGEVGIARERIEFVPYCVTTPEPSEPREAARARLRAELGIGDTTFVVFSAARLHSQRCIDRFIAAMPDLADGAPTQLVLAGDGPDDEALRGQARGLGVDAHVTFLGRRNDVPDLLCAADAYATMSVRGHIGVGGMQAVSFGLPTVAWEWDPARTPATDDPAADRPCPTVTREADMARLLAELRDDAAARTRRIDHGRRYIEEQRSPAAMARSWRAAYGAVLGREAVARS